MSSLFSKESERFSWWLLLLSFVLFWQNHTSSPLSVWDNWESRTWQLWLVCICFAIIKLNQDYIFNDKLGMDIVKIDKSVYEKHLINQRQPQVTFTFFIILMHINKMFKKIELSMNIVWIISIQCIFKGISNWNLLSFDNQSNRG